MRRSIRKHRQGLPALGVLAAMTAFCLLPAPSRASDHGDTAENYNRIGADMTDVYIFPSPENDGNVVLVMNVHGLIPAGQGANVSFDPGVLYQIKIDTSGDFREDLVIQAKFTGAGPTQKVAVAGPMRPFTVGTTAFYGPHNPVMGTINTTFAPNPAMPAMRVFAGVRADSFFFDVGRLYQIFPDRKTPLSGQYVSLGSIMAANTPQLTCFRGFKSGPPACTEPSVDFFANLNVLSIVVELPRTALGGGMIGVWATTSLFSPNSFLYQQQDRLARPAVNEALATVSEHRHDVNNKDNPTDDVNELKNDLEAFLTFPAGRSRQIKDVIESVLVPDVMLADLSVTGKPAAYLGVESGGATGSKFGGRALTDDVVDIDLGAVFGNTVPALGLAPDDGKEIPTLTTDNVDDTSTKGFSDTFPYLGTPH